MLVANGGPGLGQSLGVGQLVLPPGTPPELRQRTDGHVKRPIALPADRFRVLQDVHRSSLSLTGRAVAGGSVPAVPGGTDEVSLNRDSSLAGS